MAMDNLFFAPDLNGKYYQLPEDESKHLIRVLRRKTGDEVFFTDGKGVFYTCRIIDDHPKHCKVEVVSEQKGDDVRDYYLQIAVAPTKNISRFEWFLEKATEIGIDRITPFVSVHSERKDVKHERLDRVIIAAMKQSLKSHKPVLDRLVTFKELVQQPFEGKKYIAYIDENVTTLLSKVYPKGEHVLILIGPEGDFSPEEVELSKKNGFQPVSLGKSRLRTETAALVACHTINLLNQ
jgi:16S rRNA (uracil1498-N3)-methyltransferase